MALLQFAFTFTFISYLYSVAYGNYSPVIGILTLSCADDPINCPEQNATTYFPSQYVKWLESGGARVIPLFADDSFPNVQKLLPQLNGVLLTGGTGHMQKGNIWWDQLNNILSYLTEFHKLNPPQSIPLWGTCLGFQAMLCWTAGHTITVEREAEAIMLPLNFTNSSIKNEALIFGNGDVNSAYVDKQYADSVYDKLSAMNITYNHHQYGVSEAAWRDNPSLNGNFSLLANSFDAKNISFASLVEAHKRTGLYWYGSQFHPEIPEYIFFKDMNINHGFDTMMSNTYFSQFFVNECRIRNNNVMDAATYNKSVIYNYNPYFMNNGEYEQMYLFTKPYEKTEE